MRSLVFLLLFIFGNLSFANAEEKFICSSYYAYKLKGHLPTRAYDKWKHCTLSCWLARRCGANDAMQIGLLKELWDLVSPGNAEWEDIEADAQGISFYQEKQAGSDKECSYRCSTVYPKYKK